MTRTFHQTGTGPGAVGIMPAHDVTTRAEYPGPCPRYATLFPIGFWPNPLPPFTKLQYTHTAA
jgi:hypothetical protein